MPRLSQDRNLPVAITNLRLCSALQYCGALGVANAFDKSSAEYLYIYDDSKLGYTDWADVAPEFVSKCFVATNPNNNTIVLLPLDHRILTGKSVVAGGVCDGMLLTEKEMCLIEFKTNVTSSNYQTIDFYVVYDKDLEVTGANSELMDLQTQFLTDKSHPLYFDNGKTFL